MRKRKRGEGTYIDDETGTTCTFQTTKAAKRAHQKSGTWYKAPTERELRIWEREDAQQHAAEKLHKRELNKKINAEKRAEKAAREQELKQRMFDDGKITFTQTLAKKDEDQLNLHGWFGGGKKKPDTKNMTKVLPPVPKWTNESAGESKQAVIASIAQKLSQSTKLDELMTEDLDSLFSGDMEEDLDSDNTQQRVEIGVDTDQPRMNNAEDHFEIAEDSSAKDVGIENTEAIQLPDEHQAAQLDSAVMFSPTKRPPLSPLSKADLNTRAAITPRMDKIETQDKTDDANTTELEPEAVQDLLSGLCTQDLDEADDLFTIEKENQDPCKPRSPEDVKKAMSQKAFLKSPQPTITPKAITMSFGESNTDYDSLFAELDPKVEPQSAPKLSNCGDDELDDETLLSLPAVQTETHLESEKRKTLKPADSFAVDGLSDNDLLEGLDDYERSQSGHGTKKRRTLPWDNPEWFELRSRTLPSRDGPEWDEALMAHTVEIEDVSNSQCTELLDD